MTLRDRIYLDVETERLRQEDKWGIQHHDPTKWLAIIGEEYGESCLAVNEDDMEQFRKELIECAASCIAAVEDIDSTPKGVGYYWDQVKRIWASSPEELEV